MTSGTSQGFKPHLLCIAPPYGNRAPAGTAYLLGYLKSQGCDALDFLDLRLSAPFDFTPTYRTTGAFGESYVLDTPDLPLILQIVKAFADGRPLAPARDELFVRYCLERAISPHYLEAYLCSLSKYYESVFDRLPDIRFIGFSTWTPNFLSTLMAAAHLKRRRNPPFVVAGGPQVTASRASAAIGVRSGLFDVVVLGEGEQTLHQVFSDFEAGREVSPGTPGTLVLDRASGQLVRSERKQLALETLPLPSFEEMPLMAYQTEAGYRAIPFQLSRGCTDKCAFCSEWVFWKHYRSDTPEHAVEQLKELKARYGVNFIEFTDSLLNGHPRRLMSVVDQMISSDVRVGWTSFMRAQMDADAARLLARSGCTGVFIGVESFSDEALQAMNKRRTEADNVRAIRAFVEAGIHVTAGFIPGFPGDSRPGFMHSVQVLRELQDRYPGRIELHEEPFTVMANAPMISKLESFGLTPQAWADEYLDILTDYRDVTAGVLCSVQGDGQGMERLGRMALVGAIKTDAPTRGRFDEGADDETTVQTFDFEHLYRGWSLAQKRSGAGHRYCLIVDGAERAEIERLQEQYFPLDPIPAVVTATLSAIETRHLAAGTLAGPRLVRCLYPNVTAAASTFALSPYVLVRAMGRRDGHQLLAVDTVTGRSSRRPRRELPLLHALANRAETVDGLSQLLADSGTVWPERRLRQVLLELKEEGLVIVTSV